MPFTEAELAAKALADYEQHRGKIVEVKSISGYIGSNSHDFDLNPPAKVRVDDTQRDCITSRWCDDWLDPVWDVTLVEPHPQLEGVTSMWIYATSYHADGRTDVTDIVAASS